MSVLTFLRSYISPYVPISVFIFSHIPSMHISFHIVSPLCVCFLQVHLYTSLYVHSFVFTFFLVHTLLCMHTLVFVYSPSPVYFSVCTLHHVLCNLHWMYNKLHYVYIMCTVFNVYSIVFHADSWVAYRHKYITNSRLRLTVL